MDSQIEDNLDSDAWTEEEPIKIPVAVNSNSEVQKVTSESDADSKLPEGFAENLDLLEYVLRDKSDVFSSKIINIMLRCHIDPNDPVFLLLLAVGELELLLLNTPANVEDVNEIYIEELSSLFQQYFGSSDTESNLRFKAAIEQEKAAIATAVSDLIAHTNRHQFFGNLTTMTKMFAPALGVIVASIALGVVGTWQYSKLTTRSLIGAGKLTPEQYADLQWASSSEGKLAKQIMELNKGYVGSTCKQDAEAMNIGLQVGNRKVKSGFCVLFVEPPNKRKYE